MYINPFWAGVLAVVVSEFLIGIIASMRYRETEKEEEIKIDLDANEMKEIAKLLAKLKGVENVEDNENSSQQ